MLDPNLIRNEIEKISEKLKLRGFQLDMDELLKLENNRKFLQIYMENLQSEHNSQSQFIGQVKTQGKDTYLLHLAAKRTSEKINKAKSDLEIVKKKILNISLNIPNLPDDSVPPGKDKNNNIEIKRWGKPREFDFKIRDHITLGKIHGGLDFPAAVKLTGSRFVVMKGKIAHLHRALAQFMIDLHTEQHGYSEIYVPYIVNHDSLCGTGQLPKFSNDLFHINSAGKTENNNYALIPTAEVPLINLVRNEILNERDLPIKLVAHSPCFRSEAGSYGKDVHALIRMHQFDKVEIVQIVHPKDSMDILEEITNHAEKVLELLNLPYRRVILCAGDMSFVACKTYDLEVWIPTQHTYREVSSCSHAWDFQARRIQARYRSKFSKKTYLVHTLNGSGLAVGRTLVAVLENYQLNDGRIEIPNVLRPYMKGQQYID